MKKNVVWKVLAALAAVTALCVIGVKLYRKFAKKKEEALDEAEEVAALPETEGAALEAEEEIFEAPADAVIANADDMEETPVE